MAEFTCRTMGCEFYNYCMERRLIGYDPTTSPTSPDAYTPYTERVEDEPYEQPLSEECEMNMADARGTKFGSVMLKHNCGMAPDAIGDIYDSVSYDTQFGGEE